jgi:hypothetical protein
MNYFRVKKVGGGGILKYFKKHFYGAVYMEAGLAR